MAKRSTQTIINIDQLTDEQVLALVGAIPAARVKRAKEALAARTGAGPARTYTAQAVTLTIEDFADDSWLDQRASIDERGE